MFGKNKPQEESNRLVDQAATRHRQEQLQRDPSSIKGMTQTELNAVIDTDTIPTQLLHQIL